MGVAFALSALAGAACVGDVDPEDGSSSSSSSSSSGGSSSGGGGAPDASDGADASSSGALADASQPPPDAAADAGVLADVPGLALWLEADDLVRDTVFARWSDRSPNHQEATVSGTAPVVVGGNDSINGHLAVRFDAAQRLVLLDSAALQLPDEGFLIELVERHPGIGEGPTETPGALFSKQIDGVGPLLSLAFTSSAEGPGTNPSYWKGSIAAGASAQWPHPATLNTKVTNDVPHLLSFRLSQSVLSVRVDSNQADVATITLPPSHGLAAVGANAYLGSPSEGAAYRGDLAALVVVRTPDAVAVARVDAYLRQRFGFQPAPP